MFLNKMPNKKNKNIYYYNNNWEADRDEKK